MKWDGTHRAVADWNNATMFLLTRDGDIEINRSNDGLEVELLHYANQHCHDIKVEDGVDRFGRNDTDRMFVRLCLLVYSRYQETFKSLSVKNHAGIYHVRVELTGDVIEGELFHVVDVFEERTKGNGGK